MGKWRGRNRVPMTHQAPPQSRKRASEKANDNVTIGPAIFQLWLSRCDHCNTGCWEKRRENIYQLTIAMPMSLPPTTLCPPTQFYPKKQKYVEWPHWGRGNHLHVIKFYNCLNSFRSNFLMFCSNNNTNDKNILKTESLVISGIIETKPSKFIFEDMGPFKFKMPHGSFLKCYTHFHLILPLKSYKYFPYIYIFQWPKDVLI